MEARFFALTDETCRVMASGECQEYDALKNLLCSIDEEANRLMPGTNIIATVLAAWYSRRGEFQEENGQNDVSRIVGERMAALRKFGDPMADRNVARRYLRGLCEIVLGDKGRRLANGNRVVCLKDAVRYVFENRSAKGDPLRELVCRFMDVAEVHRWRTEGTIYQQVKDLGKMHLTNAGLKRKAKAERKGKLTREELSEIAKEDPGNGRNLG